jgi:hypothetical protein
MRDTCQPSADLTESVRTSSLSSMTRATATRYYYYYYATPITGRSWRRTR